MNLPDRAHKLIHLARRPAYLRALLVHGVAAAVEHEPVLRPLACRSIVDIGANRGQFALAARRCCPNARIFAFEPLARPAETFRRLFAGSERVALEGTAIGPESGSASMHVSRRDDSSSVLPITPLQDRIFPGTGLAGVETVPIGPLTAFLSARDIVHPALLKVDVQGYELPVLRGCADLLPAFEFLYIECSFLELYAGQALADEVIAFLQGCGFALRGVFNMAYDREGRAVQGDFLFGRRH